MKISRRQAIWQSVLAFVGLALPWGGSRGERPLRTLKPAKRFTPANCEYLGKAPKIGPSGLGYDIMMISHPGTDRKTELYERDPETREWIRTA